MTLTLAGATDYKLVLGTPGSLGVVGTPGVGVGLVGVGGLAGSGLFEGILTQVAVLASPPVGDGRGLRSCSGLEEMAEMGR